MVNYISTARIIYSCLGDGKEFPGLIPLIRQFLDGADVDVDTRCTITQYLNFIQVNVFACLIYGYNFRSEHPVRSAHWHDG